MALAAQFPREGGDFRDRFAFAGQRRQEIRLDFGGNARAGQFLNRGGDLCVGQRFVVRQLFGQGVEHVESVGRAGEVC